MIQQLQGMTQSSGHHKEKTVISGQKLHNKLSCYGPFMDH